MNNTRKAGLILIVTSVIILGAAAVSFADTTVITTSRHPYFHSGNGPISSIFYFLGDVVMLPFRLVGDLFS